MQTYTHAFMHTGLHMLYTVWMHAYGQPANQTERQIAGQTNTGVQTGAYIHKKTT